jgi:hypothetical protein
MGAGGVEVALVLTQRAQIGDGRHGGIASRLSLGPVEKTVILGRMTLQDS